MKFIDKMKSMFFEVEEVEVVEPEIKVPVAKKIETPEVKPEEKPSKVEFDVEEELTKELPRLPREFDDQDFLMEDRVVEETVEEDEDVLKYVETTRVTKTYEKEYSVPDYHGLYDAGEKKEEPKVFKPSEVISPVYGVLNKNYKKEEIVTKKEIRLTATSSKKADLDIVREKAYGDLIKEIADSINDEDVSLVEEVKEEDNLLYDLNDESPTVKVVTMGDAEEYFDELGLEYNVDYKIDKEDEEEKEKETVQIEEDDEDTKTKEELSFEEKIVAPKRRVDKKKPVEKLIKEEDNDDSSNLFDLIDSMYEDKED